MTRILNQMVKRSLECSFQENAQSRDQSGIDSVPNPQSIEKPIEENKEFDKSQYGQNLQKIAVVTSGDDTSKQCTEGEITKFEFTVQNQSEITWPFKPFLQNEADTNQRQLVDKILQPGESATISFPVTVPKG